MNIIRNLTLYAGFLTSIATPLLAQTNHGTTLSGQIRVAGQTDGILPIRVRLQSLGFVVRETVSFNGRFDFPGVVPGPYSLVALVPGGVPSSLDIVVPAGPVLMDVSAARPDSYPAGGTVSVLEFQIPSEAKKEFNSALKKARNRNCNAALSHLMKAVEIFHSYAEAHNAIGNCYVQLQEMERAENAFMQAVALTPSVYPALNLADVYLQGGKLKEADELLTTVLQRNPTEADAYYGLAAVRYRQERLEEAESLANEVHSRGTHNPDVHLLLGKIYYRAEQTPSVRQELELYVKEAKPGPLRNQVRESLAKKK
jgi:Flp pilus assembly protein TadD